MKLNTENFINRSREKHDNKYIYDETVYVDYYTKVLIKCSIHGQWHQLPNNHLKGSGCPQCGYEKLSKIFSSNKTDFINKANKVHNNFYNYDKVEYKSTHKKVEVTCPMHGGWQITPANHLTGYGCPKCGLGKNISKVETLWLDSLDIPQEYRHKSMYINNNRIIADAYNPITNTVYEFLGDFYHGNPLRFEPDDINPKLKLTYGQLYVKTLDKLNDITAAGYNLIIIWENEWRQLCKPHASRA